MSEASNTEMLVANIKQVFAQVNDQEKIRLISQLAQIRGHIGALAIIELLRQHAMNGEMPKDTIWALNTFKEQAEIYFPELLDYTSVPGFAHRIYSLCYTFLRADWLSPTRLDSHFDMLMSQYRERKRKWSIPKYQLGDDYYALFNEIYHLLWIFGYLRKPEIEAELYEALDLYSNPGIKFVTVDSLWRMDKQVNEKYLLELIDDDGLRMTMYWRLKERGQLQLFSEQYLTPEPFARSYLVNTLEAMYAIRPDEIEFEKIVQAKMKNSTDPMNYYVFRFYSDLGEWTEKEWLAGWAGPFPQQFDLLNLPTGNHTGTDRVTWENKSAEEHVIDFLKDFYKADIE
jgi:hypothetical protein